jgi:hypothetical protein
MLPKGKGWLIGGAILGLALPFTIKWYEIQALSPVRPIARWLLWPTSLVCNLTPRSTDAGTAILILITALGNAILYSLLAGVLRRAFLGVALLVPMLIWLFLPPSDTSLKRQFSEHRHELERLVQMADEDVQLIRISPSLVETVDGKQFTSSESDNGLSERRWVEYRGLFKSANLRDGLYKNDGDIFLSFRRVERIDPVGSSFGYLYCPALKQQYGFVPCIEDGESGEGRGHRWKKLDSGWYIYEAFNRGIE